MTSEIDISVIIATHNRADILNDTLRHMELLDRQGINVEFVIVDNNSSDITRLIIESFMDKLPIRYLFEAEPGQNAARNRALADAPLGKIVVFTDDDIEPEKNWFQVILAVCNRWPQYNIFGGRIYPLLPDSPKPKWTELRFVQELGFALHEYDHSETLYAVEKYPSSGNMWFRRSIFDDGSRFDEAIAWHPKNRIMATETIFLKRLVEQGQRIVHCPEVVVSHKITAREITLVHLLKRAYSWGRGMTYIRGVCRKETLNKNPVYWYCIRLAALMRICLKLAIAMPALAIQKPKAAVYAMQWLGFNIEQISMVSSHNKRG